MIETVIDPRRPVFPVRSLGYWAAGRSPESWLAMQCAYDFWKACRDTDLRRVSPMRR
jgi:hypothetical protein